MTELHITGGVKIAGDDPEAKRGIAHAVARILSAYGDEPYAKVSPAPTPVYVLVGYDQGTMTGDTQGAFTNLGDARAEAWLAHESYRQADPRSNSMYVTIETWEGGKFVEQRRLISKRINGNNNAPEYVWELSAAPTFNPIIETTTEDQK